jgi:hypothetical protein
MSVTVTGELKIIRMIHFIRHTCIFLVKLHHKWKNTCSEVVISKICCYVNSLSLFVVAKHQASTLFQLPLSKNRINA